MMTATAETDRQYVYLSTYDFVWINTTVTGEANPYDYVVLEACMAGQYRYGDADDIVSHAAPMFERLLLRKPFEEGNRRTALIALFTFLNTNGYVIAVDDAEAVRLTLAVESGSLTAEGAVTAMAAAAKGDLSSVSLRKLVVHECNHHAEALRLLSDND
jgi:death-on-curing family protein